MSSYLNNYRKRVFKNGKSEKEQIINEEFENFREYVNTAPNSFDIKINSGTELKITDMSESYTCTIQDVSYNDKKNFDEKLVCVYNETPLEVGKYIQWKDICLLTLFKENNTVQTHKSFISRPCNNFLNFIDNDGNIHSLPCQIENLTLYSDGMTEGKDVDVLDTRRTVLVPINKATKQLKEKQRLIFNNSATDCYEISQIDGTTMRFNDRGVFQLTLTQSHYNPNTDDKEQGLCDISKFVITYRIALAPSIKDRTVCGMIGDEIKLNPQLIKTVNGVDEVVKDDSLIKQITYVLKDNRIAMVRDNALTLLSEGETEVTGSFTYNNVLTQDTLKLQARRSIVNSTTCKLIGLEKAVTGSKGNKYSVEFYDRNGSQMSDKCVFKVTDIKGNQTDLAVIKSVNGQECILDINKDMGLIGKEFILKVENLDASLKDEIKIKITRLFG